MTRGQIDTAFIDYPPNIDVSYVRGLTTRAGLRVTDLLNALDAEMTTLNTGVDPLVADLVAPPTSETFSRASRGDRMIVEKKSEYTMARPQFVRQRGHMLAIDEYEVAIGFTEDGLQEISIEAFNDNIRAMREAWESSIRREALVRLMDATPVPVDDDTTAVSPGLAGSGTGNDQFAGTFPDGTPINPATYTHYLQDTAANRAAVIKSAMALLRKWGPGPYDLVGSETFIAAVVALGAPDFVPAGSSLVRVGSGTAEALVNATDYVGVYAGMIRVRQPIVDWTSDHGVLFKTGGEFASTNPLIMRYDPLKGQDIYIRYRDFFPLSNAESIAKYGMNINNRVGAVAIRIAASGGYLPPVIA